MKWANLLYEISNNLDNQISTELLELIHTTNRIFLTGSGRSGLALRAFEMRLSQLGKSVFFIGDTNTPAIDSEDLLIVASSSGETSQLINYADISKNIGSKIWLWSTNSNNTIYEKADYFTLLAGKSKFSNSRLTQQPMGSLFEQSFLIYGDFFVINYMNYYNITESELKLRHANLE